MGKMRHPRKRQVTSCLDHLALLGALGQQPTWRRSVWRLSSWLVNKEAEYFATKKRPSFTNDSTDTSREQGSSSFGPFRPRYDESGKGICWDSGTHTRGRDGKGKDKNNLKNKAVDDGLSMSSSRGRLLNVELFQTKTASAPRARARMTTTCACAKPSQFAGTSGPAIDQPAFAGAEAGEQAHAILLDDDAQGPEVLAVLFADVPGEADPFSKTENSFVVFFSRAAAAFP